jgi:trimethylamine---corrinoid protein Co-methyltransferase
MMRFFSRLDDAQCQRLHEATLRVLERTGLIVDEPEALELLRRAGADVDGTRVRIPERLVAWALELAPRGVTLYGRDGRPALTCGGYQYSFGAGSDCMECWDHRTGERRRALLADVVDAARVQDACEHLDFVMSLFTPSDVTPEAMDRHQMAAMLRHSTKPIVYVTLNDMTAHLDVTEMAEAVAGGPDALAARPLVACYKNTLFPLVHNAEAVRTLLDLAGRNLPCIYSPVSTAGTVAPMTVLGSTVVVNAGVLAGLVMAQLKRAGAPYIAIGWAGEALDMRTVVDIFSWPEHRAVYSSLLHWYGLPMWTLGGVTDSKLPDQQAAAEAALTLLADAVSGGHMIHDIGFMESAYTGSLTQVVLCDDIAGWVKAFLRPVEITDEELGLEAIEEVGPGELFLKHKHTRRHARDRWQPQVFDRRSREEWLAGGAGGPAAAGRAGGLDATAVAAARVDRILAEHEVPPLPAAVEAAIEAVLARAEARVLTA